MPKTDRVHSTTPTNASRPLTSHWRQDHDLEVQIADIARMGDVLRIVLDFHHDEARAFGDRHFRKGRSQGVGAVAGGGRLLRSPDHDVRWRIAGKL
jgi:hypothetical protein